MSARPGRPQAPFTAGELSPSLHERKDLKYYRSGAKLMRNVEVLPQGGFRHVRGWRQLGRLRRALSEVSLATAALAAPAGGVAANLRDGDADTLTTTGSVSGAGPVAIATAVLAAPTAIAAVDLLNFSATVTGSIAVQYHNGAGWVTFGAAKALRTTARHRRFAAPPRAPVTAASWRVVVTGLSGAGTVSIGEWQFLAEAAGYSALRLRPFTAEDGTISDHCWQGGNVDVFAAAGFADSYAVPHDAAQLAAFKVVQQADTAIAFHPDRAPHRVLRQGANTEWQSAPAPLTGLPLYDYGGAYVNGVPAIWEIKLIGLPGDATAATKHFVLTLNGDDSTVLTVPLNGGGTAPDYAAFAPLIEAAIEALPGVSAGIAVAYANTSSQHLYTVTFSGAGNEGDEWVLSMKCEDDTAIAAPAYRKQRGVAPGENVISETRGWPRCGMFYQQRLLMLSLIHI